MRKLSTTILLASLLCSPAAQAQTSRNEAATAHNFDAASHTPGLLLAMLREMPKGGDLHNHMSGAIYAESFIGWAADAGLCIRTADMTAVAAPCDSTTVPAATAQTNDDLRGRVLDAWSMRNWTPATESGHDHFFATFGKFGLTDEGRGGDELAEVAQRAADDRLSYLELMWTPGDGAIGLGSKVGWNPDFATMRAKLKAAGFDSTTRAASAEINAMIQRKNQLLHCDAATAASGCRTEIRFLYQVLRGLRPEQVFAQILAGFEAASADSNFVGFNLVMPEDGFVSMRDFSLQMHMIDYLHGLYPKVKISLHAGELVPGLVPPEGLRFHIRESVELGHASRIGHGVDVMHEDSALELLKEMAKRNVAVEICLTSNDVILGVSGRQHPLSIYQRYGVPTLLATDDEGVSRSDMTLEYMRAVEDQHLGYATLKQMARNSIKYSFAQDSVKARLLSRLDKDFAAFEAKWAATSFNAK